MKGEVTEQKIHKEQTTQAGTLVQKKIKISLMPSKQCSHTGGKFVSALRTQSKTTQTRTINCKILHLRNYFGMCLLLLFQSLNIEFKQQIKIFKYEFKISQRHYYLLDLRDYTLTLECRQIYIFFYCSIYYSSSKVPEPECILTCASNLIKYIFQHTM